MVIIDLVQRPFNLKAHYTDLGILPRWALTHDLGNVWSVSLHNLSGTSELEAAGFVFTRNRTRGTASAWLLTDLLTNKKTRPIASRLWRFQPPKLNNLRTNLTTQTRGFSTALRVSVYLSGASAVKTARCRDHSELTVPRGPCAALALLTAFAPETCIPDAHYGSALLMLYSASTGIG